MSASCDVFPPDLAEVERERDEALATVADLLPLLSAGTTREYFLHVTIAHLRADLNAAEERLGARRDLVGAR